MRDLLLVLATALLLRACEGGGGERVAAAPLAVARAERPAAMPAPQPHGEWRRRDMDGRPVLLFAEGDDRPLAGISCDRAAGKLLVERMTTSPSGGIETMMVTADNRRRTLPVLWDGASLPIAGASLDLDDRMVDSLARGSGRIELALGDEPTLLLPADRSIAELIDECRG